MKTSRSHLIFKMWEVALLWRHRLTIVTRPWPILLAFSCRLYGRDGVDIEKGFAWGFNVVAVFVGVNCFVFVFVVERKMAAHALLAVVVSVVTPNSARVPGGFGSKLRAAPRCERDSVCAYTNHSSQQRIVLSSYSRVHGIPIPFALWKTRATANASGRPKWASRDIGDLLLNIQPVFPICTTSLSTMCYMCGTMHHVQLV